MRDLYNEKYFRASFSFQTKPERMARFISQIMQYKPARVLDVGCGIGTLVKRLREMKIEAFGVDFADCLEDNYWKEDYFKVADAKRLPFEDNSFDLVFSSDFFEHVEEEEIETVLAEMKRVGRIVTAFVAPEAKLSSHQKAYHVTNRPLDWWKEKLSGAEVFSSRFDEN